MATVIILGVVAIAIVIFISSIFGVVYIYWSNEHSEK